MLSVSFLVAIVTACSKVLDQLKMGCSEGLLKFCDQWILIQINENEFLIKEGAGVRVAPYKTSRLKHFRSHCDRN